MIDLKCGDCLELIKNIPNNSIDCIVTDPPYRVSGYGTNNMGGMFKTQQAKEGKLFKYTDIDIKDYIKELYRIVKQQSHVYIFCNQKNLFHFMNVIEQSKFKRFKNLIWLKNNKLPNQFYMSQFEYILFLRKGKAKQINHCGTSSVLTGKIEGKKYHNTQKPVNLLKTLILNSTNKNDVVFDPFMGSGSTGVACIKTQRNFIGYEIEEKYFNIAKNRINEALSHE